MSRRFEYAFSFEPQGTAFEWAAKGPTTNPFLPRDARQKYGLRTNQDTQDEKPGLSTRGRVSHPFVDSRTAHRL